MRQHLTCRFVQQSGEILKYILELIFEGILMFNSMFLKKYSLNMMVSELLHLIKLQNLAIFNKVFTKVAAKCFTLTTTTSSGRSMHA